MPVHNEPLTRMPVGVGEVLLHGASGRRRHPAAVLGTNAIDWRAVLFLECKAGCGAHLGTGGQAQWAGSLLFTHVPLPHRLAEWCSGASREHRGPQDLGEFMSDKWAANCIYTDGRLGPGHLWIPPKDTVQPVGVKVEWETWNQDSNMVEWKELSFMCCVLKFLIGLSYL